jgi:hypothetical protein
MWGTNTIPSLEGLRKRFAEATFHYEPSAE